MTTKRLRALPGVQCREFVRETKSVSDAGTLHAEVLADAASWLASHPGVAPLAINFDQGDDGAEVAAAQGATTAPERLLAQIFSGDVTWWVEALLFYEATEPITDANEYNVTTEEALGELTRNLYVAGLFLNAPDEAPMTYEDGAECGLTAEEVDGYNANIDHKKARQSARRRYDTLRLAIASLGGDPEALLEAFNPTNPSDPQEQT
jgi:hypothetical protein